MRMFPTRKSSRFSPSMSRALMSSAIVFNPNGIASISPLAETTYPG
jgi:hypothetical protein